MPRIRLADQSASAHIGHTCIFQHHILCRFLCVCLRISHLHITAENTLKGERKAFFFFFFSAVQAVYISAEEGSSSILKSSHFLLLAFSLLEVTQENESSSVKLQSVLHTNI